MTTPSLNDCAARVKKFWLDGELRIPVAGIAQQGFNPGSPAADSVTLDTFIHPMDLEFYGTNAQFERVKQYVNGRDPDVDYGGDERLYPVMPQPFTGVLEDPRLIVVSFNPGVQILYDWALGRPAASLLPGTIKKLKHLKLDPAHPPGKEPAEKWLAEQERIFHAITGVEFTGTESAFVPWSDNHESLPWPFENWHKSRFKNTDAHNLRRFFGLGGDGDKVAQVEIFPYQTPDSSNTNTLVSTFYTGISDRSKHLALDDFVATLPPSARPIFDYVVHALRDAERSGIVFIFRTSVVSSGFMRRAVQYAEQMGASREDMRERIFTFTGRGVYLNTTSIARPVWDLDHLRSIATAREN